MPLRAGVMPGPAAVSPTVVTEPGTGVPPLLALTAYAHDCVLSGWIRPPAGRLTDVLAAVTLEVADATLTALDDGRSVVAESIELALDDVCLVVLVGPRGDVQRRVRTRQHPVLLKAGPYVVRGDIHAVPSADPIARLSRQRVVPLTGALVAYALAGEPVEREHEAVLLNPRALEWVDRAPEGSPPGHVLVAGASRSARERPLAVPELEPG